MTSLPKLAPLPYADNALEPHMSAKTIGYHYYKHHAGYMKKLHACMEKDEKLATMSVEEIIKSQTGMFFFSSFGYEI